MQKAAVAVEDGMSLRKVTESFQVPKSILYDRVTGKVYMDYHPRDGLTWNCLMNVFFAIWPTIETAFAFNGWPFIPLLP